MRIHWHRRDLRAVDNRGLAAAVSDGAILPVFVFDRDVLDHASPPRVSFMLDALYSLRSWYRERGSDLLVAEGDPRRVLPALAEEHGATAVTWCRDYSGLAQERDQAVQASLNDAGLTSEVIADALLHEPGTILTNKGTRYSVFTYFWKKWRDREKDPPSPAPDAATLATFEGENALPTMGELGFDRADATVPEGGTDAARANLESFLEADVYRYEDARDYPARNCTSGLSPHLKFGTIGIREVYDRVADARADTGGERRESVEEFESQLAWREFYAHIIDEQPDLVYANATGYEDGIPWRDDPAELQAWKDGETGYPLVDAGMRQLREEAWMHNRVRMVVASFLTKDLLIDWREGYDWFRERLVDHDPANDAGGWQWAASTGHDAQPYFRVFNPATQCERFDPDGEYVREYVPELRETPAEAIHEWPDLDPERRERVAPDYPAPIVDHSQRREMAIDTFEHARNS